ncbi:ketimine reductase mu-crystallin [Plakobranchus ocellatus]|uniref:Ketimine reductase mu-crystallin n=1 Tax=Plakobranchus ocellatus TaxID=259542 RepID=A0AAV4BGT0_9GAST|nr:ketimine reductase mu-crystallin [Plakobranchus ocellatus]
MQDILKYNLLFDALERGFALFSQSSCGQEASAGFIDQPVRTCVTIPSKGFFGCMPVYIEAEDLLVSKLVTAFPKNKDIPSHNAIVAVFDASCGVPRALLDGDIITTRRTAAASAVATKHLVNGEPKVLAILGCGVQGTSHYDALTAMFQLEKSGSARSNVRVDDG